MTTRVQEFTCTLASLLVVMSYYLIGYRAVLLATVAMATLWIAERRSLVIRVSAALGTCFLCLAIFEHEVLDGPRDALGCVCTVWLAVLVYGCLRRRRELDLQNQPYDIAPATKTFWSRRIVVCLLSGLGIGAVASIMCRYAGLLDPMHFVGQIVQILLVGLIGGLLIGIVVWSGEILQS